MPGILLSVLISPIVYFVQELMSEELFLVVGLCILFVIVGVLYALGLGMQRGWALMKQNAHKHAIRPPIALPMRSLQPNAARREHLGHAQ
jgi:hypothetical protein